MIVKTAAAAATAVALLIAPAGAGASKVGIDYYWDEGFGGYVPEYVAEPGEVNTVSATLASGGVRVVTFHDATATISADAVPSHTDAWGSTHEDSACTVTDPHTASCVLPDPRWMQQDGTSPTLETFNAAGGKILAVRVELGDGNDSFSPVAGSETFYQLLLGGPGRDTITTAPGGATTEAGAGNDTVFAGNGSFDWVRCGDGGDRVASRDADDDIDADCDMVAAP